MFLIFIVLDFSTMVHYIYELVNELNGSKINRIIEKALSFFKEF